MKLSFSALLKRRPIWRFTRSRNGLRPRAGSRPARRRSGAFSINAASRLKKTAHAAEQERADVARRRRYWRNWQTWLRPERLVFIDETGAKTNMARRRGRAPKGQRLPAAIPWGHWQTTTFVAGLRTTGLTAPMVIEGAMDGDAFKAYVKQLLVPSLKPRDIVIMDNLSSHKVAGVREAIKAAKAYLLYLPSYSPDLNPIELAFSKLKALLRKAAARSLEDLEQAIVEAMDQFSPQDCANFFKHAGYGHG